MPSTRAEPRKHRVQVRSPRCHQPSRRPNLRPPTITGKTSRGPDTSSDGADASPTRLPLRRITVSEVSSTHDPPSATHRLQELFRTSHPDVAKHIASEPAPRCSEGNRNLAPERPNGAKFERQHGDRSEARPRGALGVLPQADHHHGPSRDTIDSVIKTTGQNRLGPKDCRREEKVV